MKNLTFINFLLIAVLALSPLAANMHIAGHFQDCEVDFTAASADCEADNHHHHPHLTPDGAHSFDNHSDTHSNSSGVTTDCAIYHVYVGLNGCLSAALSMPGLPTRGVVNSVAKFDGTNAESVYRLRIRGPPLPS
ncbi:hypothetical protein N9850_12750 [Granulosicoccus sp.]|nr:hypothetical protein [Granulosicoccus sp.]MDB4224634.1 hypothetical protein [Granulosicoccus sp.]